MFYPVGLSSDRNALVARDFSEVAVDMPVCQPFTILLLALEMEYHKE
jgi:hypothetical protein